MQEYISNRINKGVIMNFLRLALFFGAISYLTCCQEEINAYNGYPRLNTLEVTNINSEGVTFNGVILSGKTYEIRKVGFAWSASVNPGINLTDTTIVAGGYTGNTFQKRLDFGLQKNVNYKVRAFVISGTYTIYGPVVEFKSKGSKAPVITDFYPASGKKGDTITITGDNFGTYNYSNFIILEGSSFPAIDAERKKLKFVIPQTQKSGETALQVEVAGMNARAPKALVVE